MKQKRGPQEWEGGREGGDKKWSFCLRRNRIIGAFKTIQIQKYFSDTAFMKIKVKQNTVKDLCDLGSREGRGRDQYFYKFVLKY